ncbi:gamma-mobile-trio protein GmtX [Sulfitobacter sp. 1A12157]|uniref:gamma-mobile-trio protein GmtX n=1 Tax=Sulfitobacter sp. 1A12157 TaxID=3368594 RepID=UPI003745C6B4
MGDFVKAHAIASEISNGKSPRRVRAVKNIVAACKKIIEENGSVTFASVAERIELLGLQGGPKAQSIYNTDDLKALIRAFAEEAAPKEVTRSANASFSSDEEEIMAALLTPRLKSMFRDIVADRSKALTQMRLLDSFVTKMKKTNGAIDGSEGNAIVTIGHNSNEEIEIVREFFEVLVDYGFNLEDGEIVKGNRPTNSRKFVALMQKKGLL